MEKKSFKEKGRRRWRNGEKYFNIFLLLFLPYSPFPHFSLIFFFSILHLYLKFYKFLFFFKTKYVIQIHRDYQILANLGSCRYVSYINSVDYIRRGGKEVVRYIRYREGIINNKARHFIVCLDDDDIIVEFIRACTNPEPLFQINNRNCISP